MKYANVSTQIPGQRSKTLIEEWKKYEADKMGYQAQIAIDHGKGAMLFDVDGNSFIDYTSGVLVTNVGHCHPTLVKSIQEASAKMLNVYEYCNEYRTKASKALVEAAPEHLDKCFFLSTGSEATDAAMRIMKRVFGKYEIITFYGGFHGRTLPTANAGGLFKMKKGFGPTIPGIIRVPYPYCYRCPFKSSPHKCGFICLEFLNETVKANSTDSLAGVLVEPYLGTAGFIFPPDGYMPRLEKWIREKGIIFTLDEVQSSFGRMGYMWAMEHEGLTPDIVTIGKGVGSGVPVSALLMRKEIIDKALDKGELGSTYGGNPVSCAAVCAVLEIIKKDKIIENVRKIEKIFKEKLLNLLEKVRYVGDIRGQGLVWGIELVKDKSTKEPEAILTKKLIDSCAENGLLIGGVGIFSNVIRIAPPLVINEEQAEESLDILEKCTMSL